MMILIFAQWCINHDLDPLGIYQRAYPQQLENPALKKAIESTVPKGESEDIPDETLLTVLSIFGNEELAFVISELIEKQ
ncbi:hypothetical protein H1D32_11735 [Anaerobacillus sp. CMMVII]|uniref:hypothetical protein n=1 Tax=Anaerobacillus sp. CMMVII TaxID=2755588 RepID=UPI0021B7B676|nr:hypothetical protein [Anaerobacillus sp. CMMVII]MCT8138362.1 hypothetical protein [Anaerobacillus sp. CMMVII]